MQYHPSRTYRLQPFYRNVAIVCTCFFLLIGFGSALSAFFNVDGSFARPIAAGIAFSLFWGAFVLLGLYLLLGYFRYRLHIGRQEIVETGVFRTKRTEISAIREVKWTRKAPAGGVVVTSSDAKIRVELNNFTREEREEIIAFLHGRVPAALHADWDAFEKQFSEKPRERAFKRRGLRLVMIALFFGMGVTFLLIWLQRKEPQFLMTAVMNVGFGILLIWLVRRAARKLAAERMSARSGES